MVAPNLETAEALRSMAREFAAAIREARPALSDGMAGYRIVRILEAAQMSLDQNGKEIKLATLETGIRSAAAQAGTTR
jgi:predicted dehydrogenase